MQRWIIYRDYVKEGQANSWHKAVLNISRLHRLTEFRVIRVAAGFYKMHEGIGSNDYDKEWHIKLEGIT